MYGMCIVIRYRIGWDGERVYRVGGYKYTADLRPA